MEEEQQAPWWRDAQQRNRALLITFGILALGGILFPAFTNYLFAGDNRVLVVTMAQDAQRGDRETLKRACGSLPGVSVVADRGTAAPEIRAKFSVRFDVGDITNPQYAALTSCVSKQPGVRGFLTENDGN